MELVVEFGDETLRQHILYELSVVTRIIARQTTLWRSRKSLSPQII